MNSRAQPERRGNRCVGDDAAVGLESTEDELVVVVPATFLFRHPRLDVTAGVVGTRATRTDHL